MMNVEINLKNTEALLLELSKTYKEYYENINGLFLTLRNANNYWHDGNATKFFASLEQEKLKNQKEVINISNKIEILRYIYSKYIELGKEIKCNLDNKDKVINKINQCINITSQLIKNYNSLNMYFAYEKYSLYNEKSKLNSCYNNLVTIKEKVNKTYKKIEEIETEVSNKILSLDIINIDEFDNATYIV